MTPPVGTSGTITPIDLPVGEPLGTAIVTPSTSDATHPSAPGPSSRPYVRAQPLLNLRPEFTNPIRSTREINTLGDVRDAIVQDFVRGQLGPSAQVVQLLGSFPGWLHGDRGLTEAWSETRSGKRVHRTWNPDEKPDINVVGEGEGILRRLAPLMGWDESTLRANISRIRRGMCYFNVTLETPRGPIPVKMGVVDRDVLMRPRTLLRGETYFSMRSWLLPSGTTNVFLDSSSEFQEQYRAWEASNKGEFLRRTLGTFLFRSYISSEDLVNRAFKLQFQSYESYRMFDWFKGPKQAQRLESVVPEIFVPAVQDYLANHDNLKAYHMGRALRPNDVTVENFNELNFVLDRGSNAWLRRIGAYLQTKAEFFVRNLKNARQTFRNIGSNGTRRRGYLDPSWVDYGARKFARLFGVSNELHTRDYLHEASFFETDLERAGHTSRPLRQMVLMMGYDAGGEERPEVYRDVLRYARSEVAKGANVNPLFKGTEPSKFTIPVRGVPSEAYQLMNWLMSDGMQHLTAVGTEDTKVVFDRFVSHYADEIAARGKTYTFESMGPNFTANLRRGIESIPFKGEPVVVSFGDNPLIDMDRMAHHPHRWISDWVVGPNSRTRLSHDGGKNYHVDGIHDGVAYPSKEGNSYIYTTESGRVPYQLLQATFDSRKSMADSGTKGKGRIIADILLLDPLYNTFTLQWLRNPNSNGLTNVITDGIPGAANLVGRFAQYQFMRRVLGRKVPQTSLPMDLSEHLLNKLLDVRTSLTPNHSDPGGVLDLDGVFDLAIAKELMENTERPESIYKHWDKLAPFADAILADKDRLPALEGTAARVNELYDRLRISLMDPATIEPPRGLRRLFSKPGRAFTAEELRRRGLAEGIPPMRADGSLNPEWLQIVLPAREFQFYRLGFEAYGRRAEHAKGLEADFRTRLEATRAPETSERISPEVFDTIAQTLNVDPERSRSMLIEWNFGRIDNALRDAIGKRFGVDSAEMASLERHIELSTSGNVDTPLRRIYLGLKAVDVLRNSAEHLSPEEFRNLYPSLQESIHLAAEAAGGSGGRLRSYFRQAQTTADRTFVRRVGESPPSYRNRGPHSNNRPAFDRKPGTTNGHSEILAARSAAMMPQDIHELARRLNIMPSRIPHLIAAAAHADTQSRLTRIAESRLTPERLMAWAQSEEGSRYLENRDSVFRDSFRNRVREAGPGLVVGIASLLGAEKLADLIGLDSRNHAQERFMFVVGVGHITNGVTSSVNEVLINRSLAQPFSFVTTRSVAAGSEGALQYTFEARSSFGRAVIDSMSRNFGLRGGLGSIAWNGIRGTATMPFRAAMGMGPGLMASSLVDRTLGRAFFEEGSRGRELLKFGSFFLPDLYRIGVGNRGMYLFENSLMRGASWAFSVGFIADMVFLTGNRLHYGAEGSATQLGIYQRANMLHDRNRSWYSRPIDGAFEMVAPSLSSWWDSVEFDGLSLVPNQYQREARTELRRFSLNTTDQARDLFRHALLTGIGGSELNPDFYSRVDFGFVRGANTLSGLTSADGRSLPVEQVLEQISSPAINARFVAMSSADQISYIRNEFRGYRLSHRDAESIMDHISLNRVRGDISQFGNFAISENATLRDLFDSTGSLRPGREDELRAFALGNTTPEEILEQRRFGLAVRILTLRTEGSSEVAGYESVARRAGVLNADGSFVRPELEAAARAQLDAAEGNGPTVSPAASYAAASARYARASLPRVRGLWHRAG